MRETADSSFDNRLLRAVVAIVAAAALAVMLRWALIELFGEWNRWQFSLRPEVENWALPYEGTSGPATVWALVGTASVVALSVIVLLRGRRGIRVRSKQRTESHSFRNWF